MVFSKRRIEVTSLALLLASSASGFVHVSNSNSHSIFTTPSSLSMAQNDDANFVSVTSIMPSTRKAFLASIITSTAATAATFSNANAAEEEEGFASIAARAANMAKLAETREEERKQGIAAASSDPRTIYDFTLPVRGDDIPLMNLLQQEFTTTEISTPVPAPVQSPVVNDDGTESVAAPALAPITKSDAKVKAILVVNMKQDDPIARKNIPELISLASKFGRTGEFAVICSPSDQGYFEPDTSALIRLKLASEYGYGINPATIITDKVNLLGSGAHPFWRYIEGTCRAPSGLGRIQGNFEKFLVDGRSGRAVRRYPRKYQPFDIADDIDAIMKGKQLPPAGANWKEEWRDSDKDSERDVYRFQKGLNVFDQ
uniref:Glutathione peroxidase n=1 Tax=Chaetoceros debilis TaxID=122233 RepID=A0A7S3QIX7_9STRA|mmetsp:Transcript_24056/g.36709  ORF Transcript_24056/g.36709 Transcript_24056/m.36709 type:complete len:372 (+) Transcript_24056:218-1333(+)